MKMLGLLKRLGEEAGLRSSAYLVRYSQNQETKETFSYLSTEYHDISHLSSKK